MAPVVLEEKCQLLTPHKFGSRGPSLLTEIEISHRPTTRDTNHIMPKAKIPDLDWKDYTPATVNELDILAIEQGQIENLDCNCLDCFPEVAELHEIENNTSPPQQQERSSTWDTLVPSTEIYSNQHTPNLITKYMY